MRQNAWLALPALFVVALAAYELRGLAKLIEPTREELMLDACVELIRGGLPTAPSFELLEGDAYLRNATALLTYTRQNLHGTTIQDYAECAFRRPYEGVLQLESARSEGRSVSPLVLDSWNATNRASERWAWPETQ